MQSSPRLLPTRPWPVLLAAALALGAAADSAWGVVIDFEGLPDTFKYDGDGFNLGDYYLARPGGPIFGPQTTVLEAGGGSLNDVLYPPNSGLGMLWGEGDSIKVTFSTALASDISFYYRSNTVLYLNAFGLNDVLLGSTLGPGSQAPDQAAGFLSFHAGSYSIAHVLIQDSGNFFAIDDFTYVVQAAPVPDSGATLLLGAIALGVASRLCRPGRATQQRTPVQRGDCPWTSPARMQGRVAARERSAQTLIQGPRPVQRASIPFCLALLLWLGWSLNTEAASLVLSGNENKIELTSGAAVVLPDAAPDTLTILDFSVFPPRAQHLPDLPNTVIGPPSNLAVTPDHRLALVANSVKIDPSDPARFVPESTVHVIDLQASPPRRIGEITVGRQPSGISITPDGRHALVANRADGTISLLAIDGLRTRLLQTVEVCPPEGSLSDVAIHPRTGLVLASVQKGGYLAVLRLEGGHLTVSNRKVSVYGQPYRCLITPDGQLGLTAGQGSGNGLDADALTVIDLSVDPVRTVDYVALGAVPESIDVSPKGDWIAAVTMNGSNLASDDPLYSPHGKVTLLSRQGTRVTPVQALDVGRIPEGVVFTPDGRYLVVQCHPDRALWVFELRNRQLADTGLRIPVPGMPSSLRAAP